ncbi:MAG: acetylxylan esterase, partial [Planctomycetota bacterium]|nr:acetylxylan esterase [Planctomycetota bacterium]
LILCLHPTIPQGMDGPVGLTDDPEIRYALHLVRRGFICFAPDESCFGGRVPPGKKPCDTTDFYRRHPDWSAAGKAIWDLRRALDFLVKLDGVDPDRIDALGHSHGGHGALMLAALDPRIKATVVNCGPKIMRTDTSRAVWSRPDPEDYIYYPRLRPYINRPADLPFDFDQVAMLTMPRSLLILMNYVPPEQVAADPWFIAAKTITRRAARLGAPDAFRLHLFPGKHEFTQKSRELAYAWLANRLNLAGQGNLTERPVATSEPRT